MTLVTYIRHSVGTIIRPDEHWSLWGIFHSRDCGDGLADTLVQQTAVNWCFCRFPCIAKTLVQ
jgi:hypothetical protein